MGMLNIILDTWAISEGLNMVTMVLQSICLAIALILVFLRVYYIWNHIDETKSNYKLALLQFTQLAMMIFSCGFIFIHEWNYIHLYLPTNSMDCRFWFAFLMTSFTLTRVLVFVFLMLRSSLTFHGTFFDFPYTLCIGMVAVVTFINLLALPIEIFDSIPIQPIPGKGFCFRIMGDIGDAFDWVLHLTNCVASLAAVIVFYSKAYKVQQLVQSLTEENKMSADLLELHVAFKKHITLGILTVTGTIIMFFAGEFLSVTLGIAFALDQNVNNILTFVMFKENEVLYSFLCCKFGKVESANHIVQLTKTQNHHISAPTKSQTVDSTPDTTQGFSPNLSSTSPNVTVVLH